MKLRGDREISPLLRNLKAEIYYLRTLKDNSRKII